MLTKSSQNLLFSRMDSPSSQPVPIWEMLQSLNHFCGPLWGFLQYVCASHVLRSPAADTALQIWSHQGWVEGKDQLAGDSLPNASQEAVDFLCCKSTFLSHVQFGVQQDEQVFFYKAAFQPGGLQLVWAYGIITNLVQGFRFPFVKLYEVPSGPPANLLRSFQMAVQPCGISTTLSSFVSSANFLRMHSVPSR